jgi:hypothetical protein
VKVELWDNLSKMFNSLPQMFKKKPEPGE